LTDETLFRRGTTLVRRLRLAPGEAMPWHRDPFHRVTVVLSGDALAIEYRDGGESQRFEVAPGQVDWDEPGERTGATGLGPATSRRVTGRQSGKRGDAPIPMTPF
jgi:quercetin dioxygenase-like cupin family protein